MHHLKSLTVLCLIMVLPLCCLKAQDLKTSAINYFLNSHFNHESDLIKQEHIKSIEKKDLRYYNDSLLSERIVQKYRYNKSGKPEYMFSYEYGFDKSEMQYYYDSAGNLVKKEILSYSKSSLKYQVNESYEWAYDKSGRLIQQSRYLVIDNLPADHGAHYFPEKTFLYANDTVIYDFVNQNVVIISNDAQHCNGAKAELYPPSFKNRTLTRLDFFSNNRLKHKHVTVNSVASDTDYDECGNLLTAAAVSPKCSNSFFDAVECPTPAMANICKNGDTVTVNNKLLYKHESKSIHRDIDSRGEWTVVSEHIDYYNKAFKLIRGIVTTNRSSANDDFHHYATQHYAMNDYNYYDNGLLKEVRTTDKNDVLTNRIEYIVQFTD